MPPVHLLDLENRVSAGQAADILGTRFEMKGAYESLKRAKGKKDGAIFVNVRRGKVVGLLTAHDFEEKLQDSPHYLAEHRPTLAKYGRIYYLAHAAVALRHEGTRAASALANAAQKHAKKLGYDSVLLMTANPVVKAACRRNGAKALLFKVTLQDEIGKDVVGDVFVKRLRR